MKKVKTGYGWWSIGSGRQMLVPYGAGGASGGGGGVSLTVKVHANGEFGIGAGVRVRINSNGSKSSHDFYVFGSGTMGTPDGWTNVAPNVKSKTFTLPVPSIVSPPNIAGSPSDIASDPSTYATQEDIQARCQTVTRYITAYGYQLGPASPPPSLPWVEVLEIDEDGKYYISASEDLDAAEPTARSIIVAQTNYGLESTHGLLDSLGGSVSQSESSLSATAVIDIYIRPLPENGILPPDVDDISQSSPDDIEGGPSNLDEGDIGGVPNMPDGGSTPPDGTGGGGLGPGGGFITNPDVVWLEIIPSSFAFNDTCVGGFQSIPFKIKNKGKLKKKIPLSADTEQEIFRMDVPAEIELGENEEANGFLFFTPDDVTSYTYDGKMVTNTITEDPEDSEEVELFKFGATGTGLDCEPEVPISKILTISGDLPGNGSLNFLETPTGTTSTRTVSARNSGNIPLSITSVARNAGSAAFNIGGPITSVGPGQTVLLSATFAPATPGFYDATYLVATNADNAPSGYLGATLTGVGVDTTPITRIIGFSGSLSFGGVYLSESKDRTFTISSLGNGSVLIPQVTLAKPFYFISSDSRFYVVTDPDGTTRLVAVDVDSVLAPGETTDPITVRFVPAVAGDYYELVETNASLTTPAPSYAADGVGVFDTGIEVDPEPGQEPDDDPASQPPTPGDSALDGIGSSCIRKDCGVEYVYEYQAGEPKL
jgi:hypothetical protein